MIDEVIEHLGGGAGIEHHPRLLAQCLDRLERAVDVRPRLRMDGDDVRARLGEGLEKGIDRRDHQMDTSRGLAVCGRSAFTTAGPKVMLGTKCPSITSIWIQSAPAASIARTSSPSQREVGRKDRGSDERGGHAGLSRGKGAAIGLRERESDGRREVFPEERDGACLGRVGRMGVGCKRDRIGACGAVFAALRLRTGVRSKEGAPRATGAPWCTRQDCAPLRSARLRRQCGFDSERGSNRHGAPKEHRCAAPPWRTRQDSNL